MFNIQYSILKTDAQLIDWKLNIENRTLKICFNKTKFPFKSLGFSPSLH